MKIKLLSSIRSVADLLLPRLSKCALATGVLTFLGAGMLAPHASASSSLLYENVSIEGTVQTDTTNYFEGAAIFNRNPEVLGFGTTAWARTASWWNTLDSANLSYTDLPTSGGGFNFSGTVSGRHSRALDTTHGTGTYWFSYLLHDQTALGVATIGVEIGPTAGTGAIFLGNSNGQFALGEGGGTMATMGAANTNVTMFLAKIEIDADDGASVSAWLNPTIANITDEASLGAADATTTIGGLTSFDNLNLANFAGTTDRTITIDELRLGSDLVTVIPEPSTLSMVAVILLGAFGYRRFRR